MHMRVPNAAGRDIGIPRMSSVVQMPSRSGWPHAVRGAFQCGFVRPRPTRQPILSPEPQPEPEAMRRVLAIRMPMAEQNLWIMANEVITSTV